MASFPSNDISEQLKKLATWYHKNIFQYVPDHKGHYRYNVKTDGNVKRLVKHDNGAYVCYMDGGSDDYSITFSSGRFGPDTKYSREPRTLSDTGTVSVISKEYHNHSSADQVIKTTVNKTNSYTKEVDLSVAFSLLFSESGGADIKVFKAGSKYEFTLTTKIDTKSSETHTDSKTVEKTLTIPAHSDLRYDVLEQLSTYRQKVHAVGAMDFNVTLDIYNIWNSTFQSLEDPIKMVTGKTDSGDWLDRYFVSNPRDVKFPTGLNVVDLTMTLVSQNASTGQTSLTPISPNS